MAKVPPTESHTAILLFSRSAAAEARHKGYGAGRVGDERIARSLIARTRRTLDRVGLPVIRLDETRQRGATFGERLARGMSEAFALGYDRLLVVGNDAPNLRGRHLRAAARLLEAGANVITPDRRGGVALIGIQRTDFAAERFAVLPWETSGIRSALEASLGGVTVLPPVADINRLSDIRRLWHALKSVLGELYVLVFAPTRNRAEPVVWSGAPVPRSGVVRGPPFS